MAGYSPAIAWIGGKLKIKPVLRIAEDGTLAIMEKVRGSKAALNYISGKYTSIPENYDPEYPYVFLCHGDAQEQAEKLKADILAAMPQAQVVIMPMSSYYWRTYRTGRSGCDLLWEKHGAMLKDPGGCQRSNPWFPIG